MENDVLCKYPVKEEEPDENDLKSHHDLLENPKLDSMRELEQIQVAPREWTGELFRPSSDADRYNKIETESVLDKYLVKEEVDADNLQINSIGENEINNELEMHTCHKWDQISNEVGQSTEELQYTVKMEPVLDENGPEIKLERFSDEELSEDEIHEPDLVSMEDLNRIQEDTDYGTKQLAGPEAPIDTQMVNTTFFGTSHDDVWKPKKYKCETCAYQSNSGPLMKLHMETHKDRSERTLFHCGTCGRTCTTKPHLRKHMLLHMDPKDRPMNNCDMCDYKTLSKFELKAHKLRKHANRVEFESSKYKNNVKYKCSKCSYQTDHYPNLKRHEQTHAAPSNRDLFKCATCGRGCTTKRGLQQHVMLHMDPKDRPTYQCDICDFKTIYRGKLKIHKLKHVNQANLTPAESSESDESGKTRLKKKCDKCSYRAKDSDHLRTHKETHKPRSERTLFECSTCGRSYTTKWSLEQHMVLHMDPKDRPTYSCDLCDYETIFRHGFNRHKLKHAKQAEFAFVECKKEIEQSQTQI